MRVLIIGGSGFVGSRLISEIGENTEIVNFDKNPSPFFNDITVIGDIRDASNLSSGVFKNVDSVVLLAAEHRDDVSPVKLYYDVNVDGTRNVLEAMDKFGVNKLFFTSSVAVYGLNKDNPDENHAIDPFNNYGKSKWEAEQVIKEWYYENPENKSVTVIRPTVIFGERNRGNVYNLLRQIASGKFVMIGKGENKKSMAYVGNIVNFISQSISNNKLGLNIHNYVDTPDLSMNELVKQVEISLSRKVPSFKMPYSIGMFIGYCFDFVSKVLGKKMTISSVRVKKFCARTQFNASKVHKEFKAPYTLQEGLDKTLRYEFLEKDSNKNNDDVVFYTE